MAVKTKNSDNPLHPDNLIKDITTIVQKYALVTALQDKVSRTTSKHTLTALYFLIHQYLKAIGEIKVDYEQIKQNVKDILENMNRLKVVTTVDKERIVNAIDQEINKIDG